MRNVDPTGRTPRCRASPFRTAPIPCSRTPKWILRALQLPAATSPPFLKARFVEVARNLDEPRLQERGRRGGRELEREVRRGREVRRPADELGEPGRDGVQHLPRRRARGLGIGGGGRERREPVVPAVRQAAGEPAPELRRELRVCPAVRVVLRSTL